MTINYTCVEGVSYEPKQQTENALGFDLCATELVRVDRFGMESIKTGIMLEPPNDVGFLACLRSGLAKQGLMLRNGVGIIDPDYRGEVILLVTNIAKFPIIIKPGDRVGQLIPYKQLDCSFNYKEELNETERNAGGFGSTGT